MRIIDDSELKDLLKKKSITWKDFVKHSWNAGADDESEGNGRESQSSTTDAVSPALLEVSRSVDNQSRVITNALSALLEKEQESQANTKFVLTVSRDAKGNIEHMRSPSMRCCVIRDANGKVSSMEVDVTK